MKNNTPLQFLVRTALLLAIAVLFQNLRLLIGTGLAATIVIGSLVNLTLFVAAGTVGWYGGTAVGLLTPVVAFLQGHLALPVLIPFVAAGNIVLVVAFALVERGANTQGRLWTGVAVASVLKTIALYGLIVLLFVGVMLPGMGLPAEKAKAMTAALSLSFSWPQLVTALLGGAVAVPVLRALRQALKLQKLA